MSNTERDERLLANIVELEQLGKEEEPEALIIASDILSLLDENRRLRESATTALDVETMREKAAYLLWCELIDWCKKNRVHPSTQSPLFSICGKIRAIECAHPTTEPKP